MIEPIFDINFMFNNISWGNLTVSSLKHKQVVITLALLFSSSSSYASNWLQADLHYTQYINGKEYSAKVTLLGPESYFTENKHIS